MAENKKGFVLYADQKLIFDDLSNEEAGVLIKHIFSYVNDENPTLSDRFLDMAFKSIKLQLKRDLVKYEAVRKRNSENARKRWDAVALSGIPKDTKNADKDNVTDKGKDKVIKDNIDIRKLKFADTLKPFVEKYGKEMIRAFYDYWVEPNKSNTKFRQELQKTWDVKRRLEAWSSNDANFKPKQKPQYNHDTNGLL
jgi:hypothetical protein